MTAAPFDKLAEQYDALWTGSAVGRLQREAVWRAIDPLFLPGDSVLDLGCGTGEDALHLMASGVTVHGIDSSPAMVRIARARGVNARTLPIEALDQVVGRYDGAISNFGALNCVPRLNAVADALGRVVRPGGRVALCLMSRCCVWETCHYLARGARGKAFRRWRAGGSPSSIGVHVLYPSVRRVTRAFLRNFSLTRWYGIGLLVPPSYIDLSAPALTRLAAIDRRIAGLPLLRAMADHRLFVFTRL
jgi:ubiquinone/menaquinone biosynthesis C-methylase UbiE